MQTRIEIKEKENKYNENMSKYNENEYFIPVTGKSTYIEVAISTL